jgi:alkylated DNA repair protein (DNA oxidative demethylase)
MTDPVQFAPGAWLLEGRALPLETALLAEVANIAAAAPWRRMQTPGGNFMSVDMTNCGDWGWISDRRGYRYAERDPLTDRPWPRLPGPFQYLATDAAAKCGFPDFLADACLINSYRPGARMSLHQDRNEQDFNAPIVSISLGLPATFLFGGLRRSDRAARLALQSGDVLVWGGPARLRFHGVLPIAAGHHPATGPARINLTLRRARRR